MSKFLVGFIFLSEGILKFIFPEIVGAGRWSVDLKIMKWITLKRVGQSYSATGIFNMGQVMDYRFRAYPVQICPNNEHVNPAKNMC